MGSDGNQVVDEEILSETNDAIAGFPFIQCHLVFPFLNSVILPMMMLLIVAKRWDNSQSTSIV